MNIKMIFYSIGRLLKVEAVLMAIPLIVSFIYQENTYLSFLIPLVASLICGILLSLKKPANASLQAKEGFVLVGLSWIVMSLFGCVPFIISKTIPSFINAFFETVSGFTTTGATILHEVESLPKSILFWRGFTHWIGGMGILVFILAILPNSEGQNIYILRAESTGPQVGKLVSKIKITARILYLIYIVLTITEIALLLIGKMPVFDAVVNSLSTAGTGGFGIKNDSIGSYSTYCQMVIAIFMVIFGINFNIFYLILIGRFAQAFKSEELRWFIGIIIVATTIITINLCVSTSMPFTLALKDSFFQVATMISSTGFSTTNFNLWPGLSQTVLFIIMYIGACAGSTGGGLKVSRVVILFKSLKREIKKIMHPNSVSKIRFEGSNLDESVVKGVSNYFVLIIVFVLAGTLVLSLDGFDFQTTFTAMAATINNTGPGFSEIASQTGELTIDIGPIGNYDAFSPLSKVVLILSMLIGRLEIYPILMLFNPRVWSKKM